MDARLNQARETVKRGDIDRVGVLILFVFMISATLAKADIHKIPPGMEKCTSNEVGIVFACDPSWKLDRQDKTLKITISKVPLVEMIVEKSDQKIHFISELNEEAFASMGRYEKGFHFEHLTHCDRETIKINGYLKGHPQARVSDFYLIDHLHLHSVKFTVDPKEAWEEYKWLIKGITDSMNFIKHKPGFKFNLDQTDENCEELIQEKDKNYGT